VLTHAPKSGLTTLTRYLTPGVCQVPWRRLRALFRKTSAAPLRAGDLPLVTLLPARRHDLGRRDMRRAIEMAFELRNGGQETLADWLWKQRAAGASLRAIAETLSKSLGMPVSHETVRQWMKAG
jgi:hypothetical protein